MVEHIRLLIQYVELRPLTEEELEALRDLNSAVARSARRERENEPQLA